MVQVVLTNVRGQNTSQVTWNTLTSSIMLSSLVALLRMVRERLRRMVRRHTTFPVLELPYTWYLIG